MASNHGLPDVNKGDIVLVGTLTMWSGTALLVEEVRSWGVTGVITGPNDQIYPLRLRWAEIKAVFTRKEVIQ